MKRLGGLDIVKDIDEDTLTVEFKICWEENPREMAKAFLYPCAKAIPL